MAVCFICCHNLTYSNVLRAFIALLSQRVSGNKLLPGLFIVFFFFFLHLQADTYSGLFHRKAEAKNHLSIQPQTRTTHTGRYIFSLNKEGAGCCAEAAKALTKDTLPGRRTKRCFDQLDCGTSSLELFPESQVLLTGQFSFSERLAVLPRGKAQGRRQPPGPNPSSPYTSPPNSEKLRKQPNVSLGKMPSQAVVSPLPVEHLGRPMQMLKLCSNQKK